MLYEEDLTSVKKRIKESYEKCLKSFPESDRPATLDDLNTLTHETFDSLLAIIALLEES